MAHNARVFDQFVEPIVVHEGAAANVKPMEGLFKTRPHCVDNLPVEAGAKDVLREFRQDTIIALPRWIREGADLFAQRVHATVTVGSDRFYFVKAAHLRLLSMLQSSLSLVLPLSSANLQSF